MTALSMAEVLRRIDQADVALGCAGLSSGNILRTELREARTVVAGWCRSDHNGGGDTAMVPYRRAHDLLGEAYAAGVEGCGYGDQAEKLFDLMQSRPKGGAFRGIVGWSIAKNSDGTVGVVCTDADGPGGDIAIKNAGRLEQRLLHALACAIVESTSPKGGDELAASAEVGS